MHDLFERFGGMKKAKVHFDKSGRSTRTATVIYAHINSAHNALRRYNGVPLDGLPMQISFLETEEQATSPSVVIVRNPILAIEKKYASWYSHSIFTHST